MRKRVAIIGSGELAKHIAHYVVEDKQFDVVGCLDDFAELGSAVSGYPVIGRLDEIPLLYKKGVFDGLLNGIGYARMQYRKEVFERFKDIIPFPNFIHSSCFVDPTAKVGKGVVVFPLCMLYMNALLKDNVFVQVNSIITDAVINNHSMISASVTIAGRACVGECCNLGVSTTVINDIEITDWVTTGGGTVVVKNIAEPGLYVGVPARKIKAYEG